MSRERSLADGRLRLDFPAPHVARLTIDDPPKRNALDHAILDGIAETVRALGALAADAGDGGPGAPEGGAPGATAVERVRCLLLTGAGQVFSAGYDIGSLPREELATAAEELVAHPFHTAIEALEAYEFPVVAALNGHAIGGGLELALSCDLVLASAEAVVGMPPAKLGLIYSHTGVRKFIDAVGVPRTRELFHLGRNIPAAQALDWGLVNEVVDAATLPDRAVELAAEVAANAPLALSGNKRVIRELVAAEGRLDERTEHELIALRRSCFGSDDFFEGVRAFAEKRRPRWTGR